MNRGWTLTVLLGVIWGCSLLLYSRMQAPAAMLDVASAWLRDPDNQGLPEHAALAELHLQRVLLPLGRWSEAEELVGRCGDQWQGALEALSAARRQQEQGCAGPEDPEPSQEGRMSPPVALGVAAGLPVNRGVPRDLPGSSGMTLCVSNSQVPDSEPAELVVDGEPPCRSLGAWTLVSGESPSPGALALDLLLPSCWPGWDVTKCGHHGGALGASEGQ